MAKGDIQSHRMGGVYRWAAVLAPTPPVSSWVVKATVSPQGRGFPCSSSKAFRTQAQEARLSRALPLAPSRPAVPGVGHRWWPDPPGHPGGRPPPHRSRCPQRHPPHGAGRFHPPFAGGAGWRVATPLTGPFSVWMVTGDAVMTRRSTHHRSHPAKSRSPQYKSPPGRSHPYGQPAGHGPRPPPRPGQWHRCCQEGRS